MVDGGPMTDACSTAIGLVTAPCSSTRMRAAVALLGHLDGGLAMGSIVPLGPDEQRARWLPDMYALKAIGAYALTEPSGGSDVALGLETHCPA